MENILAWISLVSGVAAGGLLFIAAARNPEKAQQQRRLGAVFFGVAALMGVLLLI